MFVGLAVAPSRFARASAINTSVKPLRSKLKNAALMTLVGGLRGVDENETLQGERQDEPRRGNADPAMAMRTSLPPFASLPINLYAKIEDGAAPGTARR